MTRKRGDTDVFTFDGFDEPEQNWSKLPHILIEALPVIQSVAELKVILYILRHTWGYQDEWKKITTEEFVSGRKRKDGSRIDSGTGLSEPAIRTALRLAEEHGFIEVVKDDQDKGRIRKYYRIREKGVKDLPPNQGVKDLPSGPKTLTPWTKNFYPRTEKETSSNKPEKNIDSSVSEKAVSKKRGGRKSEDERLEEQAPSDAPSQQEMFGALAGLCKFDTGMMDQKDRGMFAKAALKMRSKGISLEILVQFETWWYSYDWRGKKGTAPRLEQIKETWASFLAWQREQEKRPEVVNLPEFQEASAEEQTWQQAVPFLIQVPETILGALRPQPRLNGAFRLQCTNPQARAWLDRPGLKSKIEEALTRVDNSIHGVEWL